LASSHRVIQAAIGWWDSHFYEFMIGGLRYGDPEQIGEPKIFDPSHA
jgi:hypothetical protein